MLTGIRKTKLKGLHPQAELVEINDDYKESDDPTRSLQDRWTGETWFEMRPAAQDPVLKRPRKTPKSGTKRKPEEEAEDLRSSASQAAGSDIPAMPAQQPQGDEDANQQGVMIPDVPNISPLTTALRDKGANAVDGVPASRGGSSSSTMRCSISSCVLQGGHQGPHEDVAGERFVQTSDGKSMKVDEEGPSSSSSSSSGSSDELVPDEATHFNKVVKFNAVLDTNQVLQNAQAIEPNQVSKNDLATKSSAVSEPKDVFYAFEVPISNPLTPRS